MIDELEAQASAAVPPNAPPGASASVLALVAEQTVEVTCRVGHLGERAYHYRHAGVRLARSTLLRLLCPDPACAEAQQVHRRWREFTGEPAPAPARTPPAVAPRIEPLVPPMRVHAAGRVLELRPASFECMTPCPAGAHPPALLRKPGLDVFEDGRCIAGGVVRDAATGAQRPRFTEAVEVARWARHAGALRAANAPAAA